MIRGSSLVLGLLAALAAAPAAATPLPQGSAAATTGRTPEVYALLIGSPQPPAGSDLLPLLATEQDVLLMHAFLKVLSPKATFAHLPLAKAPGRHPDLRLRELTFRELLVTVQELTQLLAATGPAGESRPQVYLYYAGHGRRSVRAGVVRTDLFLAADPDGRKGPGYDGVVSSSLFLKAVVGPLAEHAQVHLIIDACQSGTIVQTRDVVQLSHRKLLPPGPPRAMMADFHAALPTVGVLLATQGAEATVEDPLGGRFSYALRTASLMADLDENRVVTYAELRRVLGQVLQTGPTPTVFGPQGDMGAPFLDLRTVPSVARIVFGGDQSGRYELYNELSGDYGVIHFDDGKPLTSYFTRGDRYFLRHRSTPAAPWAWSTFVATDGTYAALRQAPDDRRVRGARFDGQVMASPLDRSGSDQPSPPALPAPLFESPRFFGAGGGGRWTQWSFAASGGPAELADAPGAALWARGGREHHQLLLELSYSRNEVRRTENPLRYHADLLCGQLGWSWLFTNPPFEVRLGPLGEAGWVRQRIDNTGEKNDTLLLGMLAQADLLWRLDWLDPRLALRVALGGGWQGLVSDGGTNSWIWNGVAQGVVGLDWEWLL